jgi:hypothetical protein
VRAGLLLRDPRLSLLELLALLDGFVDSLRFARPLDERSGLDPLR